MISHVSPIYTASGDRAEVRWTDHDGIVRRFARRDRAAVEAKREELLRLAGESGETGAPDAAPIKLPRFTGRPSWVRRCYAILIQHMTSAANARDARALDITRKLLRSISEAVVSWRPFSDHEELERELEAQTKYLEGLQRERELLDQLPEVLREPACSLRGRKPRPDSPARFDGEKPC